MPYIKPKDRTILDGKINALIQQIGFEISWDDGAVNYTITRLLIGYVKHCGLHYSTLQNVVGLLAAVHDEFDRRVVRPYEKQKRIENGDVYPPELTGGDGEEGGNDGR